MAQYHRRKQQQAEKEANRQTDRAIYLAYGEDFPHSINLLPETRRQWLDPRHSLRWRPGRADLVTVFLNPLLVVATALVMPFILLQVAGRSFLDWVAPRRLQARLAAEEREEWRCREAEEAKWEIVDKEIPFFQEIVAANTRSSPSHFDTLEAAFEEQRERKDRRRPATGATALLLSLSCGHCGAPSGTLVDRYREEDGCPACGADRLECRCIDWD